MDVFLHLYPLFSGGTEPLNKALRLCFAPPTRVNRDMFGDGIIVSLLLWDNPRFYDAKEPGIRGQHALRQLLPESLHSVQDLLFRFCVLEHVNNQFPVFAVLLQCFYQTGILFCGPMLMLTLPQNAFAEARFGRAQNAQHVSILCISRLH